jgi:hypothetical protein
MKIDWKNLTAQEAQEIVESVPLVFKPWFGDTCYKQRFTLDCQEPSVLSVNYSWSRTKEKFLASVLKVNRSDLSFPDFENNGWEEVTSRRFTSMDEAIIWLETYALEQGWKLL